MKMENIFPHKRNTNVTVLDQIFRIGDGGYIEDQHGDPLDVPNEYALRLMQGRAWKELSWDPEDPANVGRFATHNAPKSQGRGRPPRSRQQIETDYGVEMGPDGGTKVALLKGKVVPTATLVGDEGLNALGIVEDKGAPPSGERLERMTKADVDQVAATVKAAGAGEEADTLTLASIASVPTGEAEIGDGRKPTVSVPESGENPAASSTSGPDLAPQPPTPVAPPAPPSAPVASVPPAPPPPPGAPLIQAGPPPPLGAPPAPPEPTISLAPPTSTTVPSPAAAPPPETLTPLELMGAPQPAPPAPATAPQEPPAPATASVFQGEGGEIFTVPADGDWPEPTNAMPMEYVREMAKAYDVTHNVRTSRKTLVERINGAMYEE